MVSADAKVMLAHFLSHYERAGIRLATNAAFLVHVPPNATASGSTVLQLLAGKGVRNVVVEDAYHSNIKRARINAHIKSLPPDSWLVYADVDELFHFPCELTHDCYSAQLVDRLATDPSVPAMMTSSDPRQQFPICAVRGCQSSRTGHQQHAAVATMAMAKHLDAHVPGVPAVAGRETAAHRPDDKVRALPCQIKRIDAVSDGFRV